MLSWASSAPACRPERAAFGTGTCPARQARRQTETRSPALSGAIVPFLRCACGRPGPSAPSSSQPAQPPLPSSSAQPPVQPATPAAQPPGAADAGGQRKRKGWRLLRLLPPRSSLRLLSSSVQLLRSHFWAVVIVYLVKDGLAFLVHRFSQRLTNMGEPRRGPVQRTVRPPAACALARPQGRQRRHSSAHLSTRAFRCLGHPHASSHRMRPGLRTLAPPLTTPVLSVRALTWCCRSVGRAAGHQHLRQRQPLVALPGEQLPREQPG